MPAMLEEFEPIFGEPRVEWAGSCSGSGQSSGFLSHVHSPDSSHLRICVSDFRDSTWESVHSVSQLEDMRDSVGIGGSWSDFIHYVIASIKSEDVKLLLEALPNSIGNQFFFFIFCFLFTNCNVTLSPCSGYFYLFYLLAAKLQYRSLFLVPPIMSFWVHKLAILDKG